MSSTTPDVSTIEDFDELLNLIKADADLVDNLTDEQVTELRKKFNPYGRTIEGQGKLSCISITNLSEQYMKKFLMTGLISFLYRQCDEHELDAGEPPTHMDDFDEFVSKYEEALTMGKASVQWMKKFNTDHKDVDEKDIPAEQKARRLDHKRIVDRAEGFKRRLVVRQFLDGLFQFNPDKHVRSAYANNPLDPERVTPAQVTRSDTKTLVGRNGKKMVIKRSKTETKKRANSEHVQHIPPADTFHRWNYYLDVNYEEIRSATGDLYCDKPDLEYAVNPYEQFDTEEDAKKFVQKHKNEVIADIVTIYNGRWNLMGSFKKNRDRVNFYNEKTEVIEEIFKQLEKDKKMGGAMMRKRVNRLKKKNVAEYGEEPKEFKQYRKDNPSGFESMGAEVVKDDDKNNDSKFQVHEDCPYDAVQVDVIEMSGGGTSVKRSEFFTQAEAPQRVDE
jgi:hypothetical protein